MGVPLLYCSDSYADDQPYWVEDPLTLDGEKDEGMLMVCLLFFNPYRRRADEIGTLWSC